MEKPMPPVTSSSDKTVFAAIVAILMVFIGLIPAAIVVFIYSFLIRIFIGPLSWIPYVDEIGMIWFPELLRGMIAGIVAMLTTNYFFKSFNGQAVRLSALMFWSAATIVVLVLSVSVQGITLNTLGAVATAVGLAVGLWSNEVG